MPGANQFKTQDFIEAIPGTGGIISTISKRVGCSWHTAKKYITSFPTIAKVYRDECEAITDMAELTIIKAIKNDDAQTAKWYLTMKGRDRGYAVTQRTEVSGKDGGPIETTDGLSDDERIARTIAILDAARARRTGQSDN